MEHLFHHLFTFDRRSCVECSGYHSYHTSLRLLDLVLNFFFCLDSHLRLWTFRIKEDRILSAWRLCLWIDMLITFRRLDKFNFLDWHTCYGLLALLPNLSHIWLLHDWIFNVITLHLRMASSCTDLLGLVDRSAPSKSVSFHFCILSDQTSL